ncbi:MAG: ribonuclease III [Proteobacteria bacterium]|nr:ribonuclease III [Desulfobulbaceae bacterium]MBU4153012.1 ribonuclease III [Pseudomonadota bacterium]
MSSIQNHLIPSHCQLSQLENLIGYRFTDQSLLLRALTHRSFRAEHPRLVATDNETLEFLGDAVLDLVIGAQLIALYPEKPEGELTKLRSALVQEKHLSIVANDLSIGTFLLLGKGEDQSKGRQKPSILASTYEAVVGAIFSDSNYQTAKEIIEHQFHARIDMAQLAMKASDPKSALQELTQEKHNTAPAYVLESSEGPDHAKIFTVSVHLLGRCVASASARSKKAAEQKAAAAAITHLRQP